MSNYLEPFFNETFCGFRNAHYLLLAKHQAYGFSKESIRLFLSYLKNRTQRIKAYSTFNDWTSILKGISQGSELGLLIFNIFINNVFFFAAKCEICNFAGNYNSLYSCGVNLDNVFSALVEDGKRIRMVCIQFSESKS